MPQVKDTPRLYSSWAPSVVSIVTSIMPIAVMSFGLSVNPWAIIAYSTMAVPVGVISVAAGLIGLKTKLYKLAIVSLILNLAMIVFMATR